MREEFRGRYRPTAEEFVALWKSATISTDANVLLATYEFSARTRKELFALFDSIQERIWIPYRFAEEFHTRRLTVIDRQVSSYGDAEKGITTLLAKLHAKNRHPFASKSAMQALEKVREELHKGKSEHEKLFSNDPHLARISDLLSGRIGGPPTAEEIAHAIEEGRKRYAEKIPPGYCDQKKPEPERFGDYFGWRELVQHGRQHKTSTILVTNETKEDWWHIHEPERRIGPRHELIEEYIAASGQQFYMYSLGEFMRYAKTHLNQSISSASLQEVDEISVAARTEANQDRADFEWEKPTTNTLLTFFKSDSSSGNGEEKPKLTLRISTSDSGEKPKDVPAKPDA